MCVELIYQQKNGVGVANNKRKEKKMEVSEGFEPSCPVEGLVISSDTQLTNSANSPIFGMWSVQWDSNPRSSDLQSDPLDQLRHTRNGGD